MTRFAVSGEGIESLEQLRLELMQAATDINDAATILYKSTESIEDKLGLFEKDLFECVKRTINAVEESREFISHFVATSIPQRIMGIEELMALTGENGFDGDEDSPPKKTCPKVLTKRKGNYDWSNRRY